jgi:large subunit ribosomal protein L29
MKKEPLTPRDVRQRSDEELRVLSTQLAEELFRYRVQTATSQLDDTSALKATKRELARVKTILRARQLGVEESVGGRQEEEV